MGLEIGILSLVHYIAASYCINPSMGCCGRAGGEALRAFNLSKVELTPILEICSVARWRLSYSRIEKIKLFLYRKKNEQFNVSLRLQATTSSSSEEIYNVREDSDSSRINRKKLATNRQFPSHFASLVVRESKCSRHQKFRCLNTKTTRKITITQPHLRYTF
jgi:hypothetical protein